MNAVRSVKVRLLRWCHYGLLVIATAIRFSVHASLFSSTSLPLRLNRRRSERVSPPLSAVPKEDRIKLGNLASAHGEWDVFKAFSDAVNQFHSTSLEVICACDAARPLQ